ncbi:hypothetical protein QTO34_013173 [Cnephaeus nilssonii]|uniref:PPIase cyclophilin-type domain-containing protein n=1 Tax=Cnephaeus nilssonii TaxID=3371016 RepID=A0AA40LSG8_CNENI|nr:hypothetical protein QTO34_013173 [Eptesicus nilssonii]
MGGGLHGDNCGHLNSQLPACLPRAGGTLCLVTVPELIKQKHNKCMEPWGHASFQLFADKVPDSRNSRALSTGEKGIIPGFVCRHGDFTRRDGTGGRSISREKSDEDNLILKHTGPGILSMENAGPTTRPRPSDGRQACGLCQEKGGTEAVAAPDCSGSRNGQLTIAD